MKLQTGKIATGDEFTGREELLEHVNTYLDLGQSVVLVAPRRYGKSSTIQKIIETRKDYKAIQIDLMKIYNKRDLAEAIIEESYKLVGLDNILEYAKKVSMEAFETITKRLGSIDIKIEELGISSTMKLFEGKDDDELLEHALMLTDKIAQKLEIKVLFAIDELGEIYNLKGHEKILSLMRSIFQKASNVIYLFAGSQYSLMNHIFTDKASPFFRFAELAHVPTMKVEEFEGFFQEVFKKMQVSLYGQFTDDVVNTCGGIPYYIIRTAQRVLVNSKVKKKINVFPFSVCRAVFEIYRQEESYFMGELNKVKGRKHYIQLLKILASEGEPYRELENLGVVKQNVNKMLLSLTDDGLIRKHGGRYEVIDPFLRRYIEKGL